jgi:hydrogenase-4 component F
MVMLLVFVSITAIPPSGMFVSEFLVFKGLFEARHMIAFILILLLLTLVIYALGKNILSMLFLQRTETEFKPNVVISPWESATQFILLILAIYLGFNPPAIFVELINESIALLP